MTGTGRAFAFLGIAAAALGLSLAAGAVRAEPWPERRRDPFPTDAGYIIVPAPWSLPGIGQGIAYVVYVSNVAESHADAYLYVITGDAEGFGTGFEELHLYPRRLLLELYTERINRAQVFQYPKRGMDTEKNDYQLVDVRDVVSNGGRLTLSFDERRFELFGMIETGRNDVVAFRERDGDLIQKLDEPLENEQQSQTVGFFADLTDDRYDPRRGARAILDAETFSRESSNDPRYYRVNAQVDFFIPIGKQSTWAIDLFRSAAVVQSAGETNPDVVVRDVCPVPDPFCEGSAPAQDYVANAIAGNRNGSSDSLGGRDRMQAYPDNRFQGAYAAYIGTELRLNLTDEVTPFDYLIWKDVRTAIQLALIAETGTVAETEGGLWKRSRSDYGIGFRMVMAGGGLYRADYVTGDEGPQLTIIVGYPW